MTDQNLCPELAPNPPPSILTITNIDDVTVDNFNRTPGTNVNVSCFAPRYTRLVGDPLLECLSNGSWNKPVPRCISKALTTTSSATTTLPTPVIGTASYLPIAAGLGVAALAFVFLIIYVFCFCYRRRPYNKQTTIYRATTKDRVTAFARDRPYATARFPPAREQPERGLAFPEVPTLTALDPFNINAKDRLDYYRPTRPFWFSMLPKQNGGESAS